MFSDVKQEIKDTVKYEEGLFIGQYLFYKKRKFLIIISDMVHLTQNSNLEI